MKRMILPALLLISAFMIHPDDGYGSLFSDGPGDTNVGKDADSDKYEKFYDFSLTIKGEHKFGFHIPVIPDHLDFSGNIKAPRLGNELGVEINYKQLQAAANIRMDIVLNDFSAWYEVVKFRPLENYISWSPWKFTFTAGLQNFSWGLADGMNPTDNINPRDYTTGVEAEKLSVLSAGLKFYPVEFLSLETVYVPFEQNDLFPKDVRNEIPAELFYGWMFNGSAIVQVPVEKKISRVELPFDPSSFILGGKANFFFKNADFSFSYLCDIDPYWTPEITLNRTQAAPLPVYMYNVGEIKLVRGRIHRFGADVKVNAGRFGMWLEACYSMTDDYLMNSYKKRNHGISWTTGFDFNAGPDDLAYFNFQVMGEAILRYDAGFYKDYKDGLPDQAKTDDRPYMEEYYYRALADTLGGHTEGMNIGAILNIKLNLLDNLLSPSLTAIYAVPAIYDYDRGARYGGVYFKPELDIMPLDSFHISIGADLYFAWKKEGEKIVPDADYKTGIFQNSSNIYISLKYKWDYELRK